MSTGMQLERSEVKMSGYYNNWSVSDMDKYVKVPLSDEDARSLKSGDYVYLTGTIYTARDAAHKRMQEALDRGEALPIGMKNNVIYYMGPSPAREGRPIGSAGPTTASRMDKYAPGLLDLEMCIRDSSMILYIVRPSLLFVIFFYRRFIQVITFCVNYYNRRKVLYGQFTDSFCSKIIICNDLRRSNCAGQKLSLLHIWRTGE